MQFLYQPLTWCFFLVLLPLVIHLINLMRQKKVHWAAMEFLLKSYKKHRRWVWLRQFLLLLLRMLLVAAIVAMLAKLVTRDEWTSLFSGRATHHYVLLDDSLSMADRAGSVESFDLALKAVSQICLQASKQGTVHKLTLLRFSQATKATVTDEDGQPSPLADLNAEIINQSLQELLEEKSKLLKVTDLTIGPLPALQIAEQLINAAENEKQVLHLVSDFREETWHEPTELRGALQRLEKKNTQIRFVRCVSQQRANLAIVNLSPAAGTVAAGVPFFVDVAVKNFGPNSASNVEIDVRVQSHPKSAEGIETAARTEELPSVVIEDLASGEQITKRIQVYFADPGHHVIHATLAPDAVMKDNQRWYVVDVPEAIPVLIIDDDPRQKNAYYLQTAFQPGERTKTGIRASVSAPTVLRDMLPEDLARYRAIYLTSFSQLDSQAIENIRTYLDSGGGIAYFLGPESNTGFINDLHAAGLFPVEVAGPANLAIAADGSPDVRFDDNPIFAALRGERNPFAAGIRITEYIKAAKTNNEDQTPIQILATLRNGDPLVVEKRVGDGRAIAFMTTADTRWNNWAREPSFVVVMLQLHGYLANTRDDFKFRTVGTPLDFQLDSAKFAATVRLKTPSINQLGPQVFDQTAMRDENESRKIEFVFGKGEDDERRNGETDLAGVYTVEATTLEGIPAFLRFAMNVDTRESDLAIVDTPRLVQELDSVDFSITNADQIVQTDVADDGTSWTDLLFAIVIPLLLLEQLFAYFTSYHPPLGKRSRR